MKCVMILVDGLVAEPAEDLGGKTPLEASTTPTLDALAAGGILGLTRTVPRGLPPARGVGWLAALGYDPARVWTGSAALEACGAGVALAPEDVALRCDLVTCETHEDGAEVLIDPVGGRPTVAEGAALVAALAAGAGPEGVELVPGRAHRHILVWRRGEARVQTTAPAALVDRPLASGWPTGPGAEVLRAITERSRAIFAGHPAAQARLGRGERVPTHAWPWGPATRIVLPRFAERFGVTGTAVCTTPIACGVAAAAGVPVQTVNGTEPPEPTAVAGAAVQALATADVVVVEAPTVRRSGGARRVEAIERLDGELVSPLLEALRESGADWRFVVMAEVASPGPRGRGDEPVPFVAAAATMHPVRERRPRRTFQERDARELGIFVPEAFGIVERLLRR